MNLRTSIDLYQLLQKHRTSHEENRTLALEKQCRNLSAKKKLSVWAKAHRHSLSWPTPGELFCKYLYGISLALGIFALIAGFLSGAALLSYNGKAPVNVIYFLAVAVFIPLLTMFLALLSMLRAHHAQSMLVHLSPAYWMEKILGFFPGKTQSILSEIQLPPLWINWLVIKRAQLLSLLFAIGLLSALLGIVATKDVAFAWSTTLHVSPDGLHTFLHGLAWPWRTWIPAAVPSVELIEKSQYFRLGGQLDRTMVANADVLGEWWKFLACATLFYAIVLRVLVWMAARYGFRKALERSLLKVEEAEKLLYQMETPVVSSTAVSQEQPFVQRSRHYQNMVTSPMHTYTAVLGWAMGDEAISLQNDSMRIEAQKSQSVGGSHTLAEDRQVTAESGGEILLYVKSWEPPTMDILDFVTDLAQTADRVTIMPIGTVADAYIPKEKELAIWGRKLSALNHPKVWLWHYS